MDNEFRLDLSEVKKNFRTAEVISLYFALIRKTLLIDARTGEGEGPMVCIVPMASSLEERLASLKKLRPRFPRPQSLSVLPWPKYVGSLKRLGIWDELAGRFADAGQLDTVRRLESLYRDLEAMERREVRRAIAGDQYETLWER